MKTRQDKPDKTNAVIKKTYSLVSRLLAALFGAVLFAIIVPVLYWLIFDSIPTESLLREIYPNGGVDKIIRLGQYKR